MVPPLLKLEFSQGPRDGDSLEFKPGSTIRIGRIARGNDIAIKDAGISTKHLRIVSDSKNWIIHDLGSSNGTILNSETLNPDTSVNLRHGDIIKLGEYTSIVVNFVTDVQAQEHKLPPRPRRNNKRLAVSDPDPDPDPVESVQDKPKRKGRSSKQDNGSSKENGDEHELPKRTSMDSKKVNSRVGRPRKKESSSTINTKEEEVPEEKKGNFRVRRGKNTEKMVLNTIKLEVEDTPKGVEISEGKRATRRKQIENASLGLKNVKSEDTALEEEKDEKRSSRATTRSKKTEIGGDSFQELEMILNQARKSRAKRKKMEQEPSKSVVEIEARTGEEEEALNNYHVEEEEEEEDNAKIGFSDDEKVEQGSNNKNEERVEVDLGKMRLGEWFEYMEVQLPKQIIDETEKMIEPMRSKTLRVHKHIAEQRGKGRVS